MGNRIYRGIAVATLCIVTLACNWILAGIAGPQAPVEALSQYANPLEETTNDATTTTTNEAEPPDTSSPDGTYVGTTTLPEYWDTYSEGGWGQRTIEENEITIIVSPSGNVSGGINFVWKGSPVQVPGESCVYTINIYSTAILSGNLLETGGTIDVAEELSTEILRSGCPADSETNSSKNNYQAQVSIIDNRVIIGDVTDYFTGAFSFEAMKQ